LSSFLATYWPVLVPVVLGMAAIYLLLPRVRRYPAFAGVGLGSIALLFAGLYLVRASAPLPETILFYAFSAVAIIGGALLVTHHNPVYAALAFALVVLSTCGLFLLLAAPFLMAATVIIYAGAIIVTFLFVIMLAQQAGLSSADRRAREPFLASLAGFILLAAILCVLLRTYNTWSLDAYLSQVEKAAGAKSAEDIDQALGGNPKSFLKGLLAEVEHEWPDPRDQRLPRDADLAAAILVAEELVNRNPMNVADVTAELRKIHTLGQRVQALQGSLTPTAELSPFSGTPANAPPGPMPAENVAALGRSLFTDYLLAVELAGTLLLVATIGAIAIVGRRAEGMR